jgi:hypothetical protein
MPSLNDVDFNCKYGEVLNSFEDIISLAAGTQLNLYESKP